MFVTLLAFVASIVALVWGGRLLAEVLAAPATHEREQIAKAIAQGAQAFLRRQYLTIAVVGSPICALVEPPS